MLPLFVTTYGITASLAALIQARQLLQRRRSCDLSASLFAIYLGGYGLWVAYGLSIGSVPLVAVNIVGAVSIAFVLAVALSLRGSLWRPRTWRSCPV